MDFGLLTLAFWLGLALMILNTFTKSVLIGIACMSCFLYSWNQLMAVDAGWFAAAPIVLVAFEGMFIAMNLMKGGFRNN